MKIIAAKKDNVIYYGNQTKIAKLIGVHYITIKRFIKYNKSNPIVNGFDLYFNTKKV
jgi:hypothetical protein